MSIPNAILPGETAWREIGVDGAAAFLRRRTMLLMTYMVGHFAAILCIIGFAIWTSSSSGGTGFIGVGLFGAVVVSWTRFYDRYRKIRTAARLLSRGGNACENGEFLRIGYETQSEYLWVAVDDLQKLRAAALLPAVRVVAGS
jgi:hypothetical protein